MTQLQTTPWWWEAAQPRTLPSIDIDSSSDTVIIGAGFAGLSAAITLARAGKTVQVFDAEDPGRGASSRNGGMASGNLKYSLPKYRCLRTRRSCGFVERKEPSFSAVSSLPQAGTPMRPSN